MRKNIGHTLGKIVATAMLVLAAAAVHIAAAPGEAQARCDGHTEVKSRIFGSAGRVLAEEWPKAGSCNSNNTYTGQFISRWSGWKAYLWYQNSGVWRGWSCDWQIACEYSYTDDNYHSYIHLCVSNGSEWYCGWGTEVYHRLTHEAYGVNWGY